MNKRLDQYCIYAIKTPMVDPKINIERKRPTSFFEQLKNTNTLIDQINCNAIELGWFDIDFTYDAVHWTQNANKFIFKEVIKHL